MRQSTTILTSFLFFFLIIPGFQTFAQGGFKSEDELIRQAEKYFADKNYEKALPLFSQIVSNRPENAHFNYCLGVSIMNAGSDKASASRFLDIATKSPQNPVDSWIYLGRSLHMAGHDDEAIIAFDSFRQFADKNDMKKYDVETLIAMSRNALNSKNDLSLASHKIISKSETVFQDIPSLYAFDKPEGRFLALPQQYEVKQTKGKPESMFVFLSNSTPVLVYSNQSTKGNMGYDIFKAVREPNGNWLPAEALQNVINTSADEAFPVITNGGKTIYFSSKGPFSTGGYDVFRSDFDISTGRWSEPTNLGSPVNSAEDDFYYVPAADHSYAFVSSTRESVQGKCSVYKLSIDQPKGNFVAIEGTFTCPQQLEMSEAKITIVDPSDKTVLLQFRTMPASGTYSMKLPVGSKLNYQVEMKGFEFQQQLVDLSAYKGNKIIQEITLIREADRTEKMTVTNREPVTEQMAGVEKNSTPTLQINSGQSDNATEVILAAQTQQHKTSENKPEPLVSIINTESQPAEPNTAEQNPAVPESKSSKSELVAQLDKEPELFSNPNSSTQKDAFQQETMVIKPAVTPEQKEEALQQAAKIESEKTPVVTETANQEIAQPIAEVENSSAPATGSNKQSIAYNQKDSSNDSKLSEPVNSQKETTPLVADTKVSASQTPLNFERSKEEMKVEVAENSSTPGDDSKQVNHELTPDNSKNETESPVLKNDPKESKKINLRSIFGFKKKEEPVVTPISEPVAQTAPVEVKPKTTPLDSLKNVIFKVQLGAFSNRSEEDLASVFREKGIYNLSFQRNAAGLVQVLTGNENAYDNARQLKEVLVEMGFKDAFVVVFAENHQIPVELVVQVTD